LSLVKVEELSYTYPYAREAALKKVNLKIDRGEFILLLGPSGCGKSTLAMTLNGVIPHEMGGEVRGSVQVCGMNTQDYRVSDFARKVGIVFQNPDAQIIHSRVEDEVTFPMQNLLVPPGEMQRRRDEVLGIVGLTAQRRSLVHTLSGGQKQRLAIAAALSMNPELLILDEPTAHLDPKGTKEVMSTVEKLNREGNITVVLIEHKLDEITKYADRIAIMNQGTMVDEGEPRALLRQRSSYLLNDLGLFIPQISQAAGLATKKGYKFDNMPVTLEEFPQSIRIKPRVVEPTPGNTEPVIEVESVSFAYRGGAEVLTEVSARIGKGEIVALLGSNGSGKTTLAKILVGLLKPTAGRARANFGNQSFDIAKNSPKSLCRYIGYSFQNPEHRFVTEKVFDEVAFSLQVQNHTPEDEIVKRTNTMLDTFGLLEFSNEHPLSLSMGQKRRLSIATVLILEPVMIIFDEPMTGQDKRGTDYIIDLVQKLREKGTTSLFITHDMHFVADVATSVIVLDGGRVIFRGTPQLLFNSSETLARASLADPMIHRLACRLDPSLSGIIRVGEFYDAIEAVI